ncbi:MAG: hypothetical protein FWD33_04045 [Alphaproteobacteria bacterium]|nr:hypothetical protein [Alphaproteobacteria bacterium]
MPAQATYRNNAQISSASVFFNRYDNTVNRGRNAANNVSNNVNDNSDERGALLAAFDTCIL